MTDHPRSMLYVSAESLAEGAAAHVHVTEIKTGLARRGWQTELLSPSYRAGTRPGLLRRLLAISRVNYRAWQKLGSVDAIYCRANPLLLPIAWIAKRRGVIVVHECNGPYADINIAHPNTSAFFRLFVAMQRWQYRNADAVVTVTDKLKVWLNEERGKADVALISNAANTDIFTPEAVSTRATPNKFVVFFGALAVWHGARMMLEAVRHPDWPADVDLVVIGAGADSALVEEAAAKLPRIRYLGRQPYKSIPGLIVDALAGLVPIVDVSGRASTGLAPLKLFETLAAGLPAIVTDYPTQADLIRTYDCGIVIPPDAADELARAVARLARDPALAKAMGERGRRAVESAHSWDHRASDIDRLLRGLAVSAT